MKKKYYMKSWKFILVILFGFFLSSTISFCLAAEKKVAKPAVPGVMIVSPDALVIRTSHDPNGKPIPCGWGGCTWAYCSCTGFVGNGYYCGNCQHHFNSHR